MMYLLIAVGVAFALLMLAGLWLSMNVLADTFMAPFRLAQAKEERRREREFEALLRSDASEAQMARKRRKACRRSTTAPGTR